MSQVLKIAVADDEVDMRDFYQCMLRALGHQVIVVAETGKQLVESCRCTRPDLIITDIMMPEMNGNEAVAEICRDEPIPVILISACHDPDHIGGSINEHVMAYLVKPIGRKDLEQTIDLSMRRFKRLRQLRREAADRRKSLDHKTGE